MFSSRLLAQFVAVAEELHFGRAAARVHMAQSPLSQAIRRLEDNLGVALFARTKRAVALTPAGEVFLRQARAMLRAEDATVAMVKQAQASGSGRLAIGFVGNVAYGIVPRLLREFRRDHPAVHVDLAEMLTREQLGGLMAGQLDVAIVRLPVQQDTGMSIRVIGVDRFMLAMPARHRLAGLPRVALGQLAREPFIAYSSERVPVLHSAGTALCMDEGFYPNIVCQVWQASSILSFVAAGVGVALVPSDLGVFEHAGVVFKPLDTLSRKAELDIAVVWRTADRAPALQALLECMPEVRPPRRARMRRPAGGLTRAAAGLR